MTLLIVGCGLAITGSAVYALVLAVTANKRALDARQRVARAVLALHPGIVRRV